MLATSVTSISTSSRQNYVKVLTQRAEAAENRLAELHHTSVKQAHCIDKLSAELCAHISKEAVRNLVETLQGSPAVEGEVSPDEYQAYAASMGFGGVVGTPKHHPKASGSSPTARGGVAALEKSKS